MAEDLDIIMQLLRGETVTRRPARTTSSTPGCTCALHQALLRHRRRRRRLPHRTADGRSARCRAAVDRRDADSDGFDALAHHWNVVQERGRERQAVSRAAWRLVGLMHIAESYERIHRSNLVGMGILPLQFEAGENVESLGLTGEELFTIETPAEGLAARLGTPGRRLTVTAERVDGTAVRFTATIRIDTPQEILYYENGGILPYVLRQLLKS